MKSKYLLDPDWYAFLYVAGELTDEQREEFESLLLEHQSLREAVARGVELTGGVASALRTSSAERPPRPATWSRVAALTVLTVSASLVFAFLLRELVPGLTSATGSLDVSKGERPRAELAIAWSETPTTWDLAGEGDDTELDAATDDDESEVSEDDLSPPSWMLAALAPSAESADETSGNN